MLHSPFEMSLFTERLLVFIEKFGTHLAEICLCTLWMRSHLKAVSSYKNIAQKNLLFHTKHYVMSHLLQSWNEMLRWTI